MTITAQIASPPASVPYACLDEVKLIFRLSSIGCESDTPPPKRMRLEYTKSSTSNSDMLFCAHSPSVGTELTEESEQMLEISPQLQLELSNPASIRLDLGHEHYTLLSKEPPAIASVRSFIGTIGTSVVALQPTFLPDRSPHNVDTMFADLAELIDIGLRSMICDKVVQMPPQIGQVYETGRPKLAEISPVLFSPGYREVGSP